MMLFPSGSNTYVGLVVAFAPVVISWFGYNTTPAFDEQLPNTIAAIVQILGLGYAFYSRAKAEVPGWFVKK